MVCIDTSIFLVILTCLLNEWRSLWFQQATQEEPFPPVSGLTSRARAFIYLGLTGGSFLLMFGLARELVWPATLIALGATFILNFLILLTLHKVLSLMRQNKRLSIYFIAHPQVWLMAGLIIAVELSFLNWVKEVTTYFKPPFGEFTLVYSLFLFVVAMTLTLTVEGSRFSTTPRFIQMLLTKKRFLRRFLVSRRFSENRYFVMVAVLDSALVILLTSILLHLTLAIMYSFNIIGT